MNIKHFRAFIVVSWHLNIIYASDSECVADSQREKKTIEVLNPIVGKKVPVKDSARNYSYLITFCEKQENNAGVLQTSLREGDDSTHVVGKVTSTDIKTGSSWIFLTYKDGDRYGSHCNGEPRQAHILILCGSSLTPNHAVVIEENNNKTSDCYYMFEMQSSIACPKSSMSFGWILVIIILSLSAVYLLVGFMYQRFVLQAKGKEQIPNLPFWMKVGNMAADGCDFVCRCNSREETRSYKGLGDDQLGLDEDEERDENILPMY